jgi:hypothetical protein
MVLAVTTDQYLVLYLCIYCPAVASSAIRAYPNSIVTYRYNSITLKVNLSLATYFSMIVLLGHTA